MVTLGSCKVPCAHSSLHIAPVLPASLFGRLSLVTTTMQIDLGAAMSQMSDMEHEMQSHEGCRCVLLVVWVIAGGGACCVLGRSASGEFVLRAVLLALHGCRHNMLCCAVCRVVCRVIGDISVRRVAGKLHFAVHQQSFVDVLPQVGMGCIVVALHGVFSLARTLQQPASVTEAEQNLFLLPASPCRTSEVSLFCHLMPR